MSNLFPNTHFLLSDDIVKYVAAVVEKNPVIIQYEYRSLGDIFDGMELEYTFYMVRNHFHLKVIDEDWEDKMYFFSFLARGNVLLHHSEDQFWHKKIEKILEYAPQKISMQEYAATRKKIIAPGDLEPRAWTDKDKSDILGKVKNIVTRQNPKRVRQR